MTLCAVLLLFASIAVAQTDVDGIMMNKKQFCNGFVYTHSSWDNYWEGTFKRDNENIGTVTTQSIMYMANYGLTSKLNVMVAAPYVWTNASAGTLHGMKGVQDLSMFLKWRPVNVKFGNNKLSLFAVGGFSTPLTDYVVDFLPMSIGLGSTTLTGRGIIDYQWKKLFVTASAAYHYRNNIELDRDSYYDTEMHITNEVEMPNASSYQLHVGYRGKYIGAEAVLMKMNTQGGFDITKNNMPFPSNRMNATIAGIGMKYTLKQHTALSLSLGANYTLAGRNVGQATAFNAGLFYAFYFGK